MKEDKKEFNLEQIIRMVSEYPNDGTLGNKVRSYIKSNIKVDKYSNLIEEDDD